MSFNHPRSGDDDGGRHAEQFRNEDSVNFVDLRCGLKNCDEQTDDQRANNSGADSRA